jgi:hypothetical protein
VIVIAKEVGRLANRLLLFAHFRVWTGARNAQDLSNVALSWEDAVADPELGRRAAREARESFDWSLIVRRHAEVYAQTLDAWRTSVTSAADARRRYRAFEAARATSRRRLQEVRWRVRRLVSRGLAAARRLRRGS